MLTSSVSLSKKKKRGKTRVWGEKNFECYCSRYLREFTYGQKEGCQVIGKKSVFITEEMEGGGG